MGCVLDRYFQRSQTHFLNTSRIYFYSTKFKNDRISDAFLEIQVRDDNKEAEYLCLSHNPFADFIAVGTDHGTIKVYDEKTLQVNLLECHFNPTNLHYYLIRNKIQYMLI